MNETKNGVMAKKKWKVVKSGQQKRKFHICGNWHHKIYFYHYFWTEGGQS